MYILVAALFLVSVLAFIMSALCGGGASFILLPLLGWLLPAAQVPGALSIGTFTSSASRIVVFYKDIRWGIVAWFVPSAIPAVWLGAKLISGINPMLLQLLIGIFLIVNLPFLFKKDAVNPSRTNASKLKLCLIGFATGFVSGLTGAVGLLFNRFYLTNGLSKQEVVATRAANELLLHVVKIVLYAMFGLLTIKAVSLGVVIAVAAICSSLAMKFVLRHISEVMFRRIGLVAMVSLGFIICINSVISLKKNDNLGMAVSKVDDGMEAKLKYRHQMFSVEFEFDEGFETERKINFIDMPLSTRQKALQLAQDADHVMLEEVYGFGKHYFEVYVYNNGKLTKHDIN